MIQLFAPLVTPFQSDESVDEEAFVENISLYEKAPLDGYVINGSSGEAEMLTQSERVRLVRLAVEHSDRKVIAGVAATSVRATMEELTLLEGLRLDAVLVRTPSYFGAQLDQVSYYREVATQSRFPVIVYQIPQCTGVRLTGSELGRIAGFENVCGVKDSLGDLSLLNEVEWPEDFRYFLGASAPTRIGGRGMRWNPRPGGCGAGVVPDPVGTLGRSRAPAGGQGVAAPAYSSEQTDRGFEGVWDRRSQSGLRAPGL